MTIYPQGTLNTTALSVPDVYVQIVPPQTQLINTAPTNNLGVVGTASWGPKNAPTLVGSLQQAVAAFGPQINRKYDLNTVVGVAQLQGASVFTCVRVTDGTDTAASAVLTSTGTALTLTALYTGSFGNGVQVTISAGSAANSYAVTVAAPGLPSERYDNIVGTGNALWVNIAAAINNGQGGLRSPSAVIVATAGAGTGTPTLATTALAGGTDGVSTITSSVLVGNDAGNPRTGMYALRSQGCSVGVLADADDSTQWGAQAAFGLSEGVYMVATAPSGTSIAATATAKATAGIDSYSLKLMVGDWVYINDQVNNLQRPVAPSGFVAGKLAALAPQNSTLNKPLAGIVGTQKSFSGTNYTNADLQAAIIAGLDVIGNPSRGGTYFGCQTGHNTSSSIVVHGDNYTRMTNYIAASLNQSVGIYIGETNTSDLRHELKASVDTYGQNMVDEDQVDSFATQCDDSNNPPSRIAAGYLQLEFDVRYLAIVEKLIVNLQGGQTVVTRAFTNAA